MVLGGKRKKLLHAGQYLAFQAASGGLGTLVHSKGRVERADSHVDSRYAFTCSKDAGTLSIIGRPRSKRRTD